MDAKRILVDNMARIFKATTRDKEIRNPVQVLLTTGTELQRRAESLLTDA